jgi:predicted outer membrane repeat protein
VASSNLDYDYVCIGTRIYFTKNKAKFGGGLALEANAKLNILKYIMLLSLNNYYVSSDANTTLFTGNSADYGGAVYVDDDTNSGTCTSDSACTYSPCLCTIVIVNNVASHLVRLHTTNGSATMWICR